jgi:hypothetical protein
MRRKDATMNLHYIGIFSDYTRSKYKLQNFRRNELWVTDTQIGTGGRRPRLNICESVWCMTGASSTTKRTREVWSVVVRNYWGCIVSHYCCCCGAGSCCGVAGESGAMANWRARPLADCRMKATSAAASAASSCRQRNKLSTWSS